jgi:Ser/Thr protein kinase RdoA (MazF antagonist)
MDDFYAVTPEEQAKRLTVLARNALDTWGISKDAAVDLIKHRENAVFSVTDGDDRYALRIHRAGYHTDAELASELQWIQALDGDGLRTPQVIATVDGATMAHVSADNVPEARQVDVLEWFDGAPIATIEEGLADSSLVKETFFTLGKLMATVHNQSEAWTPPDGFTRHAWDEDGLLGPDPFWGRYWELDGLSDELLGKLAVAKTKALADLAEFGKTPDRYGLIHADFLHENLLANDDGICLIDFDDAGFGWHLFDVATTLFFHLGEDYFDDAFATLIDGYRTKRTLSDEHLARLPLFFALRGTTYLGWTHTRSETETAQSLKPMIIAAVEELLDVYLDGS